MLPMINIPFVPQQYPDEILGSWLARTALLNGRGAWRTLLEESGFGRRIEKPLFDMPDYDIKTVKLLDYLGCSYEYAILNLSTYPYWASYERSKTEYIKGTRTVNALMRNGIVISQLNRMGQQFSQSKSLKPYFCSLCLIFDLSNYGHPYWHKSHQLPTVFYCPTHNIPLQNKCSKCAMSNQTGGKKLMQLPSLICTCGYDYRRQVGKSATSSEIYQRLTKVSVAALENKESDWSANNVKSYFDSLADELLGSKKGQFFSKIVNTFNVEEITTSSFSLKPPAAFKTGLFHRNPSTYRAPDFCLILASLNMNFATASKNFIKAEKQTESSHKKKKLSGLPQSVEMAFTELSELRKKNSKGSLAQYKKLYWYLKLNNIDSLKCFLPNIEKLPIPTIESDRFKIQKLLSIKSKQVYTNAAAFVRATLRDNKWLEDQYKYKNQVSYNKLNIARKEKNDRLIEKLNLILQEILDKEKRPVRITAIHLGSYIEFSASQIIELLKKYPEFYNRLKSINADKTRRQLVWAAKELKNEGIAISSKSIYRKAGLPFSPLTNNLVKQLTNTK
jgi:hypothetical protein